LKPVAAPSHDTSPSVREHLARRAWGRAQRVLEETARREPDGTASQDLTSVRVVRRSLARIARWPSEVDAHLELGRAYFELDLGEAALTEFQVAQHLAPKRYEGYALAALELMYRGEYTGATRLWSSARSLHSELPEFADVLADARWH
jgi:tetratricopeptide (TPR) repeat protein